MRSDRRRLNKLEGQLTPKQAFLLWMHDAHQYDSMVEYAESLKGQPDSAWPIPRLCNQMYISVTQALKGRPKQKIPQVLRQAYRDVLFLFYLHQRVNTTYLEQERYFATHNLMLAQQLSALMRERRYQEDAEWHRYLVATRLPYPLDLETAQAVDAALEHQVIPWDEVEELHQWVFDSFLAEGKTEIPGDAYRLQHDYQGAMELPDVDAVRDAFPDEEAFGKYVTGEDYRNFLTDVTDAEFDHRYETIVSVMQDLGMEGIVVELPKVPNAFLRNAPMIDGEWIDQYVVALAEWGARLQREGYVVPEPDDAHPLAWCRVVGSTSGEEVRTEAAAKIWRQTLKHLDRFPGRKRESNGRVFLHWDGCLGWRGRWVKGDLKAGLRQGLLVSRWNHWVAEQGGDVTLAGVGVGQVNHYDEDYRYQVVPVPEAREQERQRRKSLLDSLWLQQPGSRSEERFREKVLRWLEMAHDFLIELYTLRKAIEAINVRYFDVQQALFPQALQGLEELVDHTERLVELYNQNLAEDVARFVGNVPECEPEDPREHSVLDLSRSRGEAAAAIPHQAASLVDMAKVEVLDALGENRQAVELLNRYV